MSITHAARKEYLECEGQQCPYCDGCTTVEQTLESDDSRLKSKNDWELRMYVHCDDCGKRWIEVNARTWTPSEIEELDAAPEAEKGEKNAHD